VVSTLAGAGTSGSEDGSGTAARFALPTGIDVDSAGNIYVADSSNHIIRKITPAGVVTTVAGAAQQIGSDDGVGSAARFNTPVDVVVDAAGNVYVTDFYNHTIRRLRPDGTVTTEAGRLGSSGVQLGPLPGSLTRPAYIALLPGPRARLVATGAEEAVLLITLP